MHVGLLTAPFGKKSFEEVCSWAGKNHFAALEVTLGHLPSDKVLARGGAKATRALLKRHKLEISALAAYMNILPTDLAERKKNLTMLRAAIDAASALEVKTVCTLAGFPLPGKTKMQTIEQDLPGTLGPLLEHAAGKGVQIAFENWFETNIQHLDHWRRLFEVVPQKNLGLNYDPSHLFWMGIDHIGAVYEFRDRIFHSHAKDVEILDWKLKRLGVREGGWWRYVIPGFGRIPWGEYIAALRQIGYDDVLSIEHEDSSVDAESGFLKGREHLEQLIGSSRTPSTERGH